MKTTKEKRARWIQRINQHGSIAGRLNREQLTDLIADVNDAAGLLEIVLEEIKNGEIETNYSQRACAKGISAFLKEPKS